jgi:hypothetical protein
VYATGWGLLEARCLIWPIKCLLLRNRNIKKRTNEYIKLVCVCVCVCVCVWQLNRSGGDKPGWLNRYTDSLQTGRPAFASWPRQEFFLLHIVQTSSAAHTAAYPMGTCGFSSGVTRPEHEADHSSSPRVQVKNGGAIPHSSMPPWCCA